MFVDNIRSFFQLLMGKIPEPHLENPVFLDHEGSQKPFAPHYEQFIKPEIDRFEHQRIATLKSFWSKIFWGFMPAGRCCDHGNCVLGFP
jgi:hypothetical protein